MRQKRSFALVLAGGRSSRMGRDKALLDWGGETLLERAVGFWQRSGRVDGVLVAEGMPGRFSPLPPGARAVPDRVPGRGPMEGLVSALLASGAELLYVSAVDMPNLTEQAILPPPEHDAAVYRRLGRSEPLFGVYRRSVLSAAEALLEQGRGRMTDLLEAVETDYYYTPPCLETVLQNLNTPADILAAREGKDTWRLSRAGAESVAMLGPEQWAVLGGGERSLTALRGALPPVDLILGEGFKHSALPKLELYRRGIGQGRICQDDSLLALISDEALDASVPRFGLEDYEGCAALLCETFSL